MNVRSFLTLVGSFTQCYIRGLAGSAATRNDGVSTSRNMGGHIIAVLLVDSAQASTRSGVAMTAFAVGEKRDMIIPQKA